MNIPTSGGHFILIDEGSPNRLLTGTVTGSPFFIFEDSNCRCLAVVPPGRTKKWEEALVNAPDVMDDDKGIS